MSSNKDKDVEMKDATAASSTKKEEPEKKVQEPTDPFFGKFQ